MTITVPQGFAVEATDEPRLTNIVDLEVQRVVASIFVADSGNVYALHSEDDDWWLADSVEAAVADLTTDPDASASDEDVDSQDPDPYDVDNDRVADR